MRLLYLLFVLNLFKGLILSFCISLSKFFGISLFCIFDSIFSNISGLSKLFDLLSNGFLIISFGLNEPLLPNVSPKLFVLFGLYIN